MKKSQIIVFILVMAATTFSCERKNTDDEGVSVNYKIYLDRQNRFTKITEGTSTKIYEYSGNTIIITDANTKRTYFTNTKGLADSCLVEDQSFLGGWMKTIVCNYRYNSEGYIEYNGENNTRYFYSAGNRSEAFTEDSDVHHKRTYSYSYSSLPNLIDLESFRGTFLGKLDKNLVAKLVYTVGSNHFTVNYSYSLNSKNYVVKVVETLTDSFVEQVYKTVRTYEYFSSDI